MGEKKDKVESSFTREKEEGIKKLLKSSFGYAVKLHDFDGENYFVEDVTAVLADYQSLTLKIIEELIEGSFAVMKEFTDKYSIKK
jgi:hypothetical protein